MDALKNVMKYLTIDKMKWLVEMIMIDVGMSCSNHKIKTGVNVETPTMNWWKDQTSKAEGSEVEKLKAKSQKAKWKEMICNENMRCQMRRLIG